MTDIFDTGIKPTWCPGCGNFSALFCLKKAFSQLKLKPEEIVVSYDIGCGANMGNFLKTSSFFGLHGRSIPLARGIKAVNPFLTVLAVGGDGGQLGEGGNHIIHAARRNDDITAIIINNYFFSLTTGQSSPTTPIGIKTKNSRDGSVFTPVDAASLALSCRASMVARTFYQDVDFCADVIKQAIRHKGFSLVEILAPCISFFRDFDLVKKKLVARNTFKTRGDAFLQIEKDRSKDKIPIGIFFKQKKNEKS